MIEIRRPDAALIKILPPVKPQPGTKYIPSQFALPFEHNGKRYVFNTLTKQCLETVLPESAAAGEGFDELITAQFLVPENKDECAYYNQISALMRVYGKKEGRPRLHHSADSGLQCPVRLLLRRRHEASHHDSRDRGADCPLYPRYSLRQQGEARMVRR